MTIEADDDRHDADFAEALAWFDEALSGGGADDLAGRLSPVLARPTPALQGAFDCLRLLERAWPRGTPAANSPPAGPPEAPASPRAFGRYSVLRQLGQGGGGVVFLAVDPMLGREVALKVPRPEALLTPARRSRFLLEASLAARLDHPNIVPVYEAVDLGPICYIATAYCRGITLADWQRRRPHAGPPRSAAALVATLADALEHAHGRGILHRDIKPGNILLVPRSDGPAAELDLARDYIPRIADFGLAKPLDETDGVTPSGAVLGTPAYMSPEQASGRARDLGPATDIYALGVVLYELLTERPPLRGDSDLGTLRLVVSEEPIPPRRLRPAVPRDLDTICMRCLEKDPRRRYETAAGLADDLRRFLEGEPILARPVGVLGRLRRWSLREPRLAAASAGLAVLLLALAGGAVTAALTFRGMMHVQAGLLGTEAKARRSLEANLYFHQIARAHWSWRSNDLGGMRQLLESCPPELRAWEWHYLNGLEGDRPLVLRGHSGIVHGVAFSPDGRHVASTGGGGDRVRVWDTRAGRVRSVVPGHAGAAFCVAYSPDGQFLAVAGDDRLISVRDAETGHEVAILRGHEGTIQEIAFSPDGRLLASAGRDRVARVWDLETATERDVLRCPEMVQGVVFHPDGTLLATSDEAGDVRVWAAKTGRELLVVHAHKGRAQAVAFTPDGTSLVTGGEDGDLRVWQLGSGRLIQTLTGHTGLVTRLSISPDGALLASGSEDGDIKVWDLARGQERRTLSGHVQAVTGVAFSPDGNRIASSGVDRTVRIWDVDRGRGSEVLPERHTAAVMCVDVRPDGRLYASAARDGTVRTWDAAGGRGGNAFKVSERVVFATAFHPDGPLLAGAGSGGVLSLWDTATGQERRSWAASQESIYCVAFHPGGRSLATAGSDGVVRLWDHATGRLLRALRGHEGPVHCLAYSPDGRRLATSGEDGDVRIWDPAFGREAARLRGHSGIVSDVEFSPDGGRVATAGFDRTVRLWDVRTGRELAKFLGHTGYVTGLAFSPDGRRIASSGWDGGVRVWGVESGQLALALETRGVRTRGVEFSPDGRRILAGHSDGSLEVWSLEPGGRR